MAWDDFILSPTTEIEISTTVPAWLRPYLQSWYLATRDGGETMNEFTLRMMGKMALDYRKSTLHTIAINEQNDEIEPYQEDLETDYNTEVNKL
jgi:hypothetical protein